MHYHQCSEFYDPSVYPSPRRLGLTVVDDSYAVSHHYRSCPKAQHKAASCEKLLQSTVIDDTVLRYQQRLIDSVQRVMANGPCHNVTKVPSNNATTVS